MVINKRRVWKGLMMVAFININFRFFFDKYIHGDKQSYSFGFNASDTPYALSQFHQWGVGLVGTQPVRQSSTLAGNATPHLIDRIDVPLH